MLPVRDNVPRRHPPVVLWWLIGINCAVYFLETRLPDAGQEALLTTLGLVPAQVALSHPLASLLPFFTCMFLHGGLLHLLGNMWFLWIFGANVEDRMGPLRFLLFYLTCGLLAGLTHVLLNWGSQVPTIGASGAISGVLGAYLFLFPRSQLIVLLPIFFIPFFFELPAVLYLVGWFLFQFFQAELTYLGGGRGSEVAFWAHVGGFVAGAALFGLFLRPREERRPVPLDAWGIPAAWRGR